MDWIGQFVLIFVIKLVSSATITTTTPHKHEDLKTSRTYQVTENIIDIPDNRTLPPIVPNFNLVIPLNYGNNTLAANNINEQNSGTNVEENDKEVNNKTTQNEGNLKKNSISILHIKAEYDNKPIEHHQNVLSKVFVGIKDYVHSLKRGVVDGLHSFFHKHDDDTNKSEETEFLEKPNKHDKFHRNFDGVEDFGDEDDYYDEDLKGHFGHY